MGVQEHFKKSREDFHASIAAENHKLLKYQSDLETRFGKPYLNLSLHETLIKLVADNELKLADKLKSEFKISDRKYFWIKVRAYGESQQWSELSNLAKNKRNPIGLGAFVDQCLKQDRRDQAAKYWPMLSPEEREKYARFKLDQV